MANFLLIIPVAPSQLEHWSELTTTNILKFETSKILPSPFPKTVEFGFTMQ